MVGLTLGPIQFSAQGTTRRGCHVERWIFRCYPGLVRHLSNLPSSPSTSSPGSGFEGPNHHYRMPPCPTTVIPPPSQPPLQHLPLTP
uniref:Uncharacterized protein n=1 Tax=Knipowitschia caucasica TaxID=637954 RepID=A0AAV2MS20_KNICA